MSDCRICKEENRNHYMVAQQRFDKIVALLTVGTIIAYTITIFCLIATICVIVRFQAFIENFEYVTETVVDVEQTDGNNTAIFGGDNEVRYYNGTEDYNKD